MQVCPGCAALTEQVVVLQRNLDDCHKKLEDRKLIERAKGLLMKSLNLDEESAHRALQKAAQSKQTTVAKIAEAIILADQVSSQTATKSVKQP